MLPIERRLPSQVREDIWFSGFIGSLQAEIRTAHDAVLEINFADVEWVDPLPLVTLATEISFGVDNRRLRAVVLNLGEWGTAQHNKAQRRTLKFLASHGFMAALCVSLGSKLSLKYLGRNDEAAILIFGDDVEATKKLLQTLSDDDDPDTLLVYGTKPLIPLTFISFATWQLAINDAISRVDQTLFDRTGDRVAYRDTTLARLGVVLFELVKNAIEHAYRGDDRGSVAIYARARDPRSKKFGSAALSIAEHAHVCGMELVQSSADSRWLELYVGDVGRGIWADASIWAKDETLPIEVRKSIKQALRGEYPEIGLAHLAYTTRISRRSKQPSSNDVANRGSVTGLSYIDEVLANRHDVSCLFSDRVRTFDMHPFKRNRALDLKSPKGQQPYRGSAFRVCLNLVPESLALAPHWFTPIAVPTLRAEILRKLGRVQELAAKGKSTEESTTDASITLGEISLLSWKEYSSATAEKLALLDAAIKDVTQELSPTTVLRLPRGITKDKSSEIVSKWLAVDMAGLGARSRVLVLTDLSRQNAHNLEAALGIAEDQIGSKVFRRYEVPISRISARTSEVPTLVILAEDMSCAAFRFRGREEDATVANPKSTPHQNTLSTNFYASTVSLDSAYDTEKSFTNGQSFADLIAVVLLTLRKADSNYFWACVKKHASTGAPLLWGPVDWDGTDLPIYIDFAAAMQYRELARTIRHSLRRGLSLFPLHDIQCMDSLIEIEVKHAVEAHSQVPTVLPADMSGVPSTLPVALVGSVLVSGTTLQKYRERLQLHTSPAIHCFSVAASKQGANAANNDEIVALEWNPPTGLRVLGGDFEREPGTAFVRPKQLSPTNYIAHVPTERSRASALPADMYADFATNRLLKIGHWHYGHRHSLIEVDLSTALQNFSVTSPTGQSGFFRWLLGCLDSLFSGIEGTRVVVYPLHDLSSEMVRHLIAIQPAETAATFIPLHILRGRAGGLDRVAPMSIFAVNEAFKPNTTDTTHPVKTPTRKVVLLDIGFISKRTLRHIRRELQTNKNELIGSVGLMNRSSAPASDVETQSSTIYSYWRWNVPILGRSEQCLMCGALRTLGFLHTSVRRYHSELVPAIDRVSLDFSPASVNRAWREKGIEPSLLAVVAEERMGYSVESQGNISFRLKDNREETGRYWHHVSHATSSPLVAHHVELVRYGGNERGLLEEIRRGTFGSFAKLEATATFLGLCEKSLAPWVRKEYAEEMIAAAVTVDLAIQRPSREPLDVDEVKVVQFVRLFGLATLVALALDGSTKLSLRNRIQSEIKRYSDDAVDKYISVPSPEMRVMLMAALYGGNLDRKKGEWPTEIPSYLSLEALPEHVYWQECELQLGRGRDHGTAKRSILRASEQGVPFGAIDCAFQIAALLGRDNHQFFMAVGIEKSREIAEKMTVIGNDLRRASKEKRNELLRDLQSELEALTSAFQKHLVRCGGVKPVFADINKTVIAAAGYGTDYFLKKPKTWVDICWTSLSLKWSHVGYLPWCVRSSDLLQKIIDNARLSQPCRYWDPTASNAGNSLSRVWMNVNYDDKFLVLTVENCPAKSLDWRPNSDLTPTHLKEIQATVIRKYEYRKDGNRWVSVEFRMPWLETVINK